MSRDAVVAQTAMRQLLAKVRPVWRAELGPAVTDVQLDAFIREHEAEVLGILRSWQVRGASPQPRWFGRYNPMAGKPRESQAAWHRAMNDARRFFHDVVHLLGLEPVDLDLKPALDLLGVTPEWDLHPDFPFDPAWWDEADAAVRPEELVLILGTSSLGWSFDETGDMISAVMGSAAVGGLHGDEDVIRRIAERIWAGLGGRLELVALDKATACQFIAAHHSSLPYCNPRGMLYAVGAYLSGRLVAVATAGTPSGHWKDSDDCPVDGILELTRIASVAGLTRHDRRGRVVPVNASSALASRLMDLLPLSGRRGAQGCCFVTYSLAGEAATTYLALVSKGLRPVAYRRGKKPSGARSSRRSLSHVDKLVWESGSAARAPDWRLLEPHRRPGAERAFAMHERNLDQRGAER